MISELFDAIKIYENKYDKDIVSFTQELIDYFSRYSKEDIIYKLKEILFNYCINDANICPFCGSNLKSKYSKEESEYLGNIVNENVLEYLYCPNCEKHF